MMNGNFVCLIFILQIWLVAGATIDISSFEKKLKDLSRKNLGVEFMQDYYNKFPYSQLHLDGQNILNKLRDTLASKLSAVLDALSDIKGTVESIYNTQSNAEARQLVECCKYPHKTKYSYQFRAKVNMSDACEVIPEKEQRLSQYRRIDKKTMIRAFSNAYNNKFTGKGKWVYYGDESGVFLLYPAVKLIKDCYGYDCRLRKWYINAATQTLKDVVIVVDISTEINPNKALLKELITTILSTLDSRDTIGALVFAASPSRSADACFKADLRSASPSNIIQLKAFLHQSIDAVLTDNIAKYKPAFEAAFTLFKTSSKRDKLILFMTGGSMYDTRSEIMKTIILQNRRLSFTVAINVFAIVKGSDLPDDSHKFHEAIAHQNCAVYAPDCGVINPKPPTGKLYVLTSSYNLRSSIGNFYNIRSQNSALSKPIFTLPYIDYMDLGLLISVAIPCYDKGTFQGVVSIDMQLSELLNDVKYFKEGHDAYTFLVDQTGVAYLHPYLAKPVLTFEPAVPVDISVLETSDDFKEIRASMISGGSGNKTINATRSISRGDTKTEGAKEIRKAYTYYWKPVPRTNFSLAVVLANDHRSQSALGQPNVMPSRTVYHRIDLLNKTKYAFCRLNKRIALNDSSTVKLPAEAFNNPNEYYLQETADTVKEMTDYFNKDNQVKPTLLTTNGEARKLKRTILATSVLDEFWRNDTSVDSLYIAWRYIGTDDGVFREYPGDQLHSLYDPRARPWYQRSIGSPDVIVMSTPYVDETLNRKIITMSKTITRNLNGSRTSVGVMGMDFTEQHFKRLIFSTIQECEWRKKSDTCMIVDNSGLIIFHPDLVQVSSVNSTLHISEKVPYVAKDLITDGHMIKKPCLAMYKGLKTDVVPRLHLQYFYLLQTSKAIEKKQQSPKICPTYNLLPVNGTNVYILIVSKKCISDPASQSHCSCEKTRICKYADVANRCECPCYVNFQCDTELKTLSTKLVCPPPPTELVIPILSADELKKEQDIAGKLHRCFDPDCKSLNTSDTCDRIGCEWCFIDASNTRLNKPFCDYNNVCPLGKLKPKPQTTDGDKQISYVVVAVLVPVVVVLVSVILLLLAYLYRRKRLALDKLPRKEEHRREPIRYIDGGNNATNDIRIKNTVEIQAPYPDVVENVHANNEEKPDEGWF